MRKTIFRTALKESAAYWMLRLLLKRGVPPWLLLAVFLWQKRGLLRNGQWRRAAGFAGIGLLREAVRARFRRR